MAAPRPQSIPVFLLVRTAYQLLWQQRDDALRLGLIPTLISFGALAFSEDEVVAMMRAYQAGTVDQVASSSHMAIVVTTLVAALATMLLVANWLRFMLLGPMGAVGLGLSIGRTHVGFAVALIALSFTAAIGLAVIYMPLLLLPPLVSDVGFAVAFIAMLVVLARLILFAVGQAIGQPISLQDAWTISRGNGLALAATIILVQLPLWLAGTVLTNLLLAIGFGQGAPLAMLFIGSVLQSGAAILHAIVLATVFRQLVGIRV